MLAFSKYGFWVCKVLIAGQDDETVKSVNPLNTPCGFLSQQVLIDQWMDGSNTEYVYFASILFAYLALIIFSRTIGDLIVSLGFFLFRFFCILGVEKPCVIHVQNLV